MTEYHPNKINRLTPGGTQKEIIKYVIRSGGACYEPEIREYLRYKFKITAITGVKNHLEKLESDRILRKENTPGMANRWSLDEKEESSFNYLCGLILESEWDTGLADDISAVFCSDKIYQIAMTKTEKYHYFIKDFLPWIFINFIEGEFQVKRIQKVVISEELLTTFVKALNVSPSLFVTGSISKGHKSLLTLISLLLSESKKSGNEEDFETWLVYCTIYAGFILDATIYPKLRQKILKCANEIDSFFFDLKGDDDILSYRIEQYLKLNVPNMSLIPEMKASD
ncbi:hypothetical protein [uncultured Methanospirillum sp.]|uniref:hypothetical protein n=1 Tax=uncultured Methanospirillum sp. TaxID=262503 RepID=UPI0029C8B92B|nr:hypothetical protein [uncultured Methanospirillum sp.]